MFGGMELARLPNFAPEESARSAQQKDFIEAIRKADGLVIGWQACGVTLQSIRGIVHALKGWPTPVGITV
jgi:FMN reductase